MRTFNTPKSIAVESFGFHGEALTYKRKGHIFILLSYEQRQWLWNACPKGRQWKMEQIPTTRVGAFLGYTDGSSARTVSPWTNAEDLIVDARVLYDTLLGIDIQAPIDYRNGVCIVVALVQAAAGEALTGYFAPRADCTGPCNGNGTVGDYSRGTGRQCSTCDGSGTIRDEEAIKRASESLTTRELAAIGVSR